MGYENIPIRLCISRLLTTDAQTEEMIDEFEEDVLAFGKLMPLWFPKITPKLDILTMVAPKCLRFWVIVHK